MALSCGNPITLIAPREREEATVVPTEQIDVYSFGKLAMFLAAGGPPELMQNILGRQRRKFIREHVKRQNPRLLEACPEVIDVIARCTAFDPVDRPSMAELVADLKPPIALERNWKTHSHQMMQRTRTMARRYARLFSGGRHVLRQLVDQRIASIEALLDGFDSEMVRTEGSRNDMIQALVSLFGELNRGDSYTSITSPSVWQSHALGLDGRLISATIHAVRRGVAVHRGYIISAEELGPVWLKEFRGLIEPHATDSPSLRKLTVRLDDCVKEYRPKDECPAGNMDFHWKQLTGVLQTLREMTETWRLRDLVTTDPFRNIDDTPGLFVGIIPVATTNCIHDLRIENPAALMGYRPTGGADKEWLLVVTDIRGRDVEGVSSAFPTIRGVRAYQSVYEIPKDRILYLGKVLREKCVNIGADVPILAECAAHATKKCAER